MAPAKPCVDNKPDIIRRPLLHPSTSTSTSSKLPPVPVAAGLGKGSMRCISNCEDAISGMEAFLQKHTKVPDLPNTNNVNNINVNNNNVINNHVINNHVNNNNVINNNVINNNVNVEVDIVECSNTKNSISRLAAETKDDPDATEYSSSFGDTVSETGDCSGFSEAEVESRFLGDDNHLESAFDPFSGVFPMRKKKVTSHWRKFIHPLMWRCKWTELKINELKSQASNYARKLAAHDLRKPMELDQSTVEGFGSKSLPISSQHRRKKAMKRRKRKRVEDTIDVASYMSRHNLFSYLENKKSDPDGTSTADDFGNPVFTDQNAPDNNEFGTNDDQAFLELSGGENSLEWILWNIERAYSRVQNLKTQLGDVMSKHAGKFSSWENLSLLEPSDAQTSSAQSPTLSAGNGDTVSMGAVYPSTEATQHMLDYDIGDDMGDLVLPGNGNGNGISGYGEAIHVPDIIESTVGLLSAADVSFPQSQIGDSSEAILDNVLVHNQTAEVERHTFEKMNDQLTEHQELKRGEQEESNNPSPAPASELDLEAKKTMPDEQSILKSSLASDFHFPKNKRKRGERKAGSGGWSLKNSGEPDS